jgi:hypothetical protein
MSGHITSAQEKLITDALIYLNQFWANRGESLSQGRTEKYFSPDTTLIINGKAVYTGYAQFEGHFKAVSKHIRGKIRFPLQEIIGVGNKLIVRFDEDIYDNQGIDYPANVMAIFTLHNGRIQRWEEIANTRYFCKIESHNIVYSK